MKDQISDYTAPFDIMCSHFEALRAANLKDDPADAKEYRTVRVPEDMRSALNQAGWDSVDIVKSYES